MSDPAPTPTVQLGCGTLILIAIIVAIFSQGGHRDELRKIQHRLDRIEKLLEEGRSLKTGTREGGKPSRPEATTLDPSSESAIPASDTNPPSTTGAGEK